MQRGYGRRSGKDRRFIKGQKYMLLSSRENLTLEGRKSLALLLAANKRLNTAYLGCLYLVAVPGEPARATSVRAKSSPLKSRGSPECRERAYAQQSPRFRPAG